MGQLLKLLHPYYSRYPLQTILLVVFLGSDAIVVASLSSSYRLILNYFYGIQSTYTIPEIIATLVIISIIIFFGYIFSDYLCMRLSAKVMGRIRCQLFEQMFNISYRDFIKTDYADLLSTYTSHLNSIEKAISDTIPNTIRKSLMFFSALGALLFFAWRLGIVVLAILPFMFVLANYYKNRAKKESIKTIHYKSDMLNFVTENIQLNLMVRLFNLVNKNEKKYTQLSHKITKAEFTANFDNSLVITTTKIFYYAISLVAIIYSCYMVLHKIITVGDFIASMTILGVMTRSITEALQYTQDNLKASFSLDHIRNFLHTEVHAKYRQKISGNFQELSFKNVSFGYTEDHLVLENISFSLQAGQHLGIAGHSGSGKSTLTSLLLQLYYPTQGVICLDHKDAREIDPQSFYHHVAFVPQEPPLFKSTIFENIAVGKLGASRAEVFSVAKAVGIHEFIESLPQKYETKITYLENQLSGGQKQRIAIARAILRDPVILILDEITSALDPEAEREIIQLVESLSEYKTVIYISHRLKALRNMDKILVLETGKLVESGTHKELLEKQGFYAKMWKIEQSFEIAPDGLDVKVKTDYFSMIPLFNVLPEHVINKMKELFSVLRVEPGTKIVREGEIGDHFYIIVSGSVVVTKTTAMGSEVMINLEEGDYFGEIALLNKIPRTATVTAASTCLLLTLSKEVFDKTLEEYPELYQKLRQVSKDRSETFSSPSRGN